MYYFVCRQTHSLEIFASGLNGTAKNKYFFAASLTSSVKSRKESNAVLSSKFNNFAIYLYQNIHSLHSLLWALSCRELYLFKCAFPAIILKILNPHNKSPKTSVFLIFGLKCWKTVQLWLRNTVVYIILCHSGSACKLLFIQVLYLSLTKIKYFLKFFIGWLDPTLPLV